MKCGVVIDNEYNNDVRVIRETGILKEYGYDVYVLCFGFERKYYDPSGPEKITRILIPRKIKDILFFALNSIPVYEWLWTRQISKFINDNGIEILHVHDLYMSRAAYKGIGKSKQKIPLILDLHENYTYTITTYNWTKGLFRRAVSRPQAWQRKERRYLTYADRIVVLSSDFRDYLLFKYPEFPADIFFIIPNVPDLSLINYRGTGKKIERIFENDYPIIFYYGIVAERRGIFDAFEIFTELLKEGHHLNFLIIGPLDKKDRLQFFGYLESKQLNGFVHYIPWINSSELPDYLNICDICLAPFHKNPQHESGVANKIYEYMLGSKPIIASDCKPQKELIEKHNCGLIFRNMAEFKNEIIKLIGDVTMRTQMGVNGKQAVKHEYNTEKIKERFISIYTSIIHK